VWFHKLSIPTARRVIGNFSGGGRGGGKTKKSIHKKFT